MSSKSNWLKIHFGKFWLIQLIIIGTLLTYSLIATFSILTLVPILDNNSRTPGNSNTVVVTIIFESEDQNIPITWNSIVSEVEPNTTLYSLMNSTLQLNTTYSTGFGYLITGINSLVSQSPNFWTYYFYSKGSGWTYATLGVSNFLLNHDYEFKWVYGPASV